ncbi:hypothetical protein HGB24_01440 [Candidatus Saccharibacteria bacterium]|nr:hypothetical protein [Candidatus Saccharibacteria bacterium]
MSKFTISELSLYKWRYHIGYGLVAIGLAAVLFMVSLYSPGGISKQEMQSVVQSDAVNFLKVDSFAIPNLPYHLLQKASLAVFGVSIISIKLPSILLALLSAVGIMVLFRRWFSRNVGILAGLIAFTTSQFFFIAQDGTAGIMYLFWPVCLLLLASLVARPSKFRSLYKVLLFTAAALSLYTPLSIYVVVAAVIAIFLHPHLRYTIKQLSRVKLIICALIALILSIPLIIAIYKIPSFRLDIFGIPNSMPNWNNNLSLLGSQYLGFANPGGKTLLTPFFGLGSMLIIVVGAISIFKNRFTAKSYLISIWIGLLLPAVILNPELISVTYLPLILLLAFGIAYIINYWYSLFPRNPYARIGGLIPIVVLVGALILSGLAHNLYGYQYDPELVANFSKDLTLIPNNTKYLVVSSNEFDFYKVVAKHNKSLVVFTKPQSDEFLASHDSIGENDFTGYHIQKIITGYTYQNSNRFYLYKKN